MTAVLVTTPVFELNTESCSNTGVLTKQAITTHPILYVLVTYHFCSVEATEILVMVPFSGQWYLFGTTDQNRLFCHFGAALFG